MPYDSFSEMKDYLEPVTAHFPRLGKVAGNLYILVVLGEPVEDKAADLPGRTVGCQEGKKALGVGAKTDRDIRWPLYVRFSGTGEKRQ